MKRITVIGTGYVGLVTGAGLSDFGNKVVCTDVDHEKIKILNGGRIPCFEPGLQDLVSRNVKARRLLFSTDVGGTVRDSEVIFVAVGTPMRENGEADLSAIETVAKTIGRNLNGYKVICTKSTVPIGTGERVRTMVQETSSAGAEFDIVSNPEFLREGAAVQDFLIPNRVVIGSDSERALDIMREVYRTLFINETPMVLTDIVTAETIKYASNAFLATKISFINEMANLCDATGADVHMVARAMGLDGRISPKFLHPGPGFGGSCFPKDVQALAQQGEKLGVELKVVRAAHETNEAQKRSVIRKLKNLLGDDLKDKTIAVLGLAFKSNTDDVRLSPSLPLIEDLLSRKAKVKAFDPEANENMRALFPQVTYCDSLKSAVTDADAIAVMTDWREFRGMNLKEVARLVKQRFLVDARNILNPDELRKLNFKSENMGRPSVR
ncbi:MAG: UDP-glucose/GDP-mannose dehydrogenase family protein [Candidatus Neomarinimicrobiota bacterium]